MKARWQDTEGPWDRLRWARVRWQERIGVSPNAEAAAASLGIKAGRYRSFERQPGSSKHTELDLATAIQAGKKYGANWQWILAGEGTPDDKPLNQTERRVIDALREAPEDRQTAVADAITQLLKIA